MEYAVTKGKIRSLGVSNFDEEDILELLRWSHKPVSVLQNWFDPFHQDTSIRKLCAEYNIRYMGYSTLGQFTYFILKVYLKSLGTAYSLEIVKTLLTCSKTPHWCQYCKCCATSFLSGKYNLNHMFLHR